MPIPNRPSFSAFLVLTFALLSVAYAQDKPAPLPEVPEILKSAKGTLSMRKPDGLAVSVDSKTPLSAEQWSAIASLHARVFSFGGDALDDEGMERLVPLDPVMVTVNGSRVTGKGAAKFGEMKSLKALHTLHITRPTPEAKTALGTHPTLEVFSTDGAFCIEAVTAPKLQRVDLKHGGASDEFAALLKNHPSLESVRLWSQGSLGLSDAAAASLATIPKLSKLSLEYAVFTYAGGLHNLKEIRGLTSLDLKDVALSEEDLARLKADLPNAKVTFTPMTAEYRARRETMAAKKK